MYSATELCEKITSLSPGIGQCGVDIDVAYNQTEKTWMVGYGKKVLMH